jgi:hypothetical protein
MIVIEQSVHTLHTFLANIDQNIFYNSIFQKSFYQYLTKKYAKYDPLVIELSSMGART